MMNIQLREASKKDLEFAVDVDYRLNPEEHQSLNRKEKIFKAIERDECYIILNGGKQVGFVLFDYRFFDQGWIELIIIDETYRNRGIGSQVFEMLCKKCKSEKIFTSTNRSNELMQNALRKAGFRFAGEIEGLDEGDPEFFFFKETGNVS